MVQSEMAEAQERLGPFQDRYLVARNRPECDEHWASENVAWVGKASMSKRHVMLLVKDLHWEWFNVLTFGFASGLERAIAVLEEMRKAALLWATSTEGWPGAERV